MTTKPVPGQGANSAIHRQQIAAGLNTLMRAFNSLFSGGTATAATHAATLDSKQGTITSEALTTAAGSDYALTLNNTLVAANSIIVASVDNGTNTTEGMAVNRITPSAGSALIRVRNTHASAAWNGTIKVRFQILG